MFSLRLGSIDETDIKKIAIKSHYYNFNTDRCQHGFFFYGHFTPTCACISVAVLLQ